MKLKKKKNSLILRKVMIKKIFLLHTRPLFRNMTFGKQRIFKWSIAKIESLMLIALISVVLKI